MADDRGPQDLEVGGGVLLLSEGRGRDHARRVIDRADEGQPRSPVLEPVVAAAVELEEETLGRHPLAPAAVARWSTPARAGDARGPQDPLEARPADGDPAPLGEQLGQVRVVDVGVGRPPELDDPLPERGVQPPFRRSTPVAVDEAGRTVTLEGRPQPPQLALAEPDQLGRLGHRQLVLQHSGQDPRPPLLPRGHRDRRLHLWETDTFTLPLAQTDSLGYETPP